MIEPPRQLVRRGVFEVDDGILVGIKHRVVEEIAGPVQQPGVVDLGFRMNAFLVEASESGRRSDTIEAVAVVQETKFHAQFLQGSITFAPAAVAVVGVSFEAMNLSTSSSINSPFTTHAFSANTSPLGFTFAGSRKMFQGEPQLRVSPVSCRYS